MSFLRRLLSRHPNPSPVGSLTLSLLVAAGFFLLGSCAPGTDATPSRSSCKTDRECTHGRACIERRCQDPLDDEDGGSTSEEPGYEFPDDPLAGNFCPDFPYTTAHCDDEYARALLEYSDSDKDGLSDLDELCVHGTNPCNTDTDGDGVSDLIEVAYGSDPLEASDNPRERGDFVFVMPYEEASSPPRDTLDFATDLQIVDVYFLMDTTGSMGSSITSLKNSLASFIPRVRDEIANVWIGHGDFKDYQVGPYGSAGDFVYRNYQSLTENASAAVASLSHFGAATGGNDGPEGQIPALYAIANGVGLPGKSNTPAPPPCPAGHWGYPCFRDNAVPIVALITDAPMHNGPGNANSYSDGVIGGHAPTYAETVAALNARHIRVIGIGQGSGGIAHMQQLARDTGAVDSASNPLTSTWDGSTIGDTVLNQIQILAQSTKFDISAVGENQPTEPIDVVAAFVDRVEANTAGDPARGCEARAAIDGGGVGYENTFPKVLSGQRVCFDIVVKDSQTTVKATKDPQIFRANVQVIGDGFTPLDQREVLFLVPPMPISVPM